jgi:hypothetical protein
VIQTNPDGTPAPPVPRPPAPGLLTRWKLSEPVRLYLDGLVVVVVAAFVVAGWITQQWGAFAIAAAGVVLGLGGAAEAIRASVFAPTTVVGLVHAGRGRYTAIIPTPEKDAAA